MASAVAGIATIWPILRGPGRTGPAWAATGRTTGSVCFLPRRAWRTHRSYVRKSAAGHGPARASRWAVGGVVRLVALECGRVNARFHPDLRSGLAYGLIAGGVSASGAVRITMCDGDLGPCFENRRDQV